MIIVKFGGHAMKDTHGLFARSIKSVVSSGQKVIVIHGGGPQINAELLNRNIESSFVNGLRFTSDEIFSVVDEVLSKHVGPEVASNLELYEMEALSLSGKKSKILFAEPIEGLGNVGRVLRVDVKNIERVLSKNIIPVIAPLAVDVSGGIGLNINADLAAAAIAGAYPGSTLIIMTDVEGIYRNWPEQNSVISEISAQELKELVTTFSGGMLPKVQAALEAIQAGANSVRIIDGTSDLSFEQALSGEGGTLVFA
jgi:acetylglutamate kinase